MLSAGDDFVISAIYTFRTWLKKGTPQDSRYAFTDRKKVKHDKAISNKKKQMGNVTNVYGNSPSSNHTAAQLRLYKDFTELSVPTNCEVTFPNGNEDIMNFDFMIKPSEGFYRGGAFWFRANVGQMYPHFPPTVRCMTKVCHPYIDTDGNVFLNILYNDWKPVLQISQVLDAIYRLFTATFTSAESNMLDLTMDDCAGSSSGEKVYMPPPSKNLKLKRTYVYVSSMDNIYPSKRLRVSENDSMTIDEEKISKTVKLVHKILGGGSYSIDVDENDISIPGDAQKYVDIIGHVMYYNVSQTQHMEPTYFIVDPPDTLSARSAVRHALGLTNPRHPPRSCSRHQVRNSSLNIDRYMYDDVNIRAYKIFNGLNLICRKTIWLKSQLAPEWRLCVHLVDLKIFYFGARVIRKHHNRLLVRYEELIDENDEWLVEKRRIEHVRPYPPKVDHILNEGDDVDAWDGAGWWRGRIVMERKRDFVVYFNYMKKKKGQHYAYERDHVRIHQECVDTGGETAWHHVKINSYIMFQYTPGMRVEVIGHGDLYVNSYYAATVLHSDQQNVAVSYEERFNHNGEHLEEEIDVKHVRPYPPDVENYLNEGDNVDNMDGGGGKSFFEGPTNLMVYFAEYPRNRRHVTYARDDVRIHQEWFHIGPKSMWKHVKQSALPPNHHNLQIAQVPHNEGVTVYTFQVGDRVEVIQHEEDFEHSFFAATVLRVSEQSLFVRYETLIDINDDPFLEEVNLQYIRPYPPIVRQPLTVRDDVEVWEDEGWWTARFSWHRNTIYLYILTTSGRPNDIRYILGMMSVYIRYGWIAE
ncbi:hypothetical protein LXL04_004674 [Taraxacum kok-saghyz]